MVTYSLRYMGETLEMKKLIDFVTGLFGFVLNVKYGDITKNEKFDLFIPSKKSTKLVLFIHGGGFLAGDKESGRKYCKQFQKKGYFSATVGYTFLDHGNLNTMDVEICHAVDAIKKYVAKHYGTELDGMAVYGISAGGALALNYAYIHKTGSIPVKFVMAKVAPTDFHKELWNDSAYYHYIADTQHLDFENYLSGGNGAETISAVSYMNKDSCPTLLAYAGHDELVPLTQKEAIEKKLKENSISFDIVFYPNSSHSCEFDSDSDMVFERFTNKYLYEYLR